MKTELEKQTKTLEASIEAKGDSRCFTAMITTDALDRDGEAVIPDGMDKRDFMANPILLYMHDAEQPIGSVNELKRVGSGWQMTAELAPKPDSHPANVEWQPDTVHHLMKAKVLRGISIGFMPTESRHPTDPDITRWGKGLRRVISKYKLCEVSVVSIPCNQEALITAVHKGLTTAEMIKKVFDIDIKPEVTPLPEPAIIPPVVDPPAIVPKRFFYHEEVVNPGPNVDDIVAKTIARAQGKMYYTPKG